MEKLNVSKNPTLEVISEIEPHTYNAGRTHYNRQAQMTTANVYRTSTNQLSSQVHGRTNQGYTGSSQSSINRDSQNSINRDGSSPSVGGVYREQYWICSEPLRCRNWTKRERILFIVLFALSTIVLGLVAAISLITRSREDSQQSPPGWFPWL
ncbi:hypothetical protein HA402_007200 [Bradysia odoriphaga]|nr:hypothetical protein HA402_007200 [Bradysia odoriphaga]